MAKDTSGLIDKILNIPSPLSADQTEAVLSEHRYNRVIAGAGAGKTETLTRRIVYRSIEGTSEKSYHAFD